MAANYHVAETILKIENLSVSYDKPVLFNVNAEIRNIVRPEHSQGQVVGVLGPSGIGKTQLFRCTAGLQAPTTGTVTLTEKHVPVVAGSVGVVPQHYPLFNHRTIEGNLSVAAEQKGFKGKEAKERVEAMMHRFGLSDHRRKYPGQLSGGQRQRVSIAQQMLCSGHFLLMDEPFSGLDPVMKDEVAKLIAEVAAQDELNTIVVITHDIESAASISDTLWLIGRERDHAGTVLGANIRKIYNLIDLDLAWQPEIQMTSRFSDFVREIRREFHSLL